MKFNILLENSSHLEEENSMGGCVGNKTLKFHCSSHILSSLHYFFCIFVSFLNIENVKSFITIIFIIFQNFTCGIMRVENRRKYEQTAKLLFRDGISSIPNLLPSEALSSVVSDSLQINDKLCSLAWHPGQKDSNVLVWKSDFPHLLENGMNPADGTPMTFPWTINCMAVGWGKLHEYKELRTIQSDAN